MVYPMGTLGASIGYNSPATIARMLEEAKGKIETATVEEYLSPIQPWGFRLLQSACDPQEGTHLAVSQMTTLFEVLRTMFDYVLVDMGRVFSRLALPVIQMSRGIVIVVTSDINVVKQTRITLDYIATLGIPRSKLILINNRTEARVWVSKEDTEDDLKLPVAGTIPFEGEYLTMAVNAQVPFIVKFPDRPASRVFVDVAHALLQHAGK
jgi:pilus assembly protein CpaE